VYCTAQWTYRRNSVAHLNDGLMNEAETRAEHIDPALTAAGCGVVD